MSRVIIVDPDFEHAGGHNLTANSVITSGAGGEVTIVAPVTLPDDVDVSGAMVKRLLPCNSYRAAGAGNSLMARFGAAVRTVTPGLQTKRGNSAIAEYSRVLQDVCDDLDIGRADSIVVHTGSEVLLAALLDIIERLPDTRRPVLHYRQVRPVSDMAWARCLHGKLAHLVAKRQAFIYSETAAFKQKLASLGHSLSGIESLELVDCSRPYQRQSEPTELVNIAVVGTVRREKGHARLAAIAREYARFADRFHGPRLRYLIHAGHVKNRKLFTRVLKSLDAVGADYELAEVGPGEEVHWRCLADCHVVLIPYDGPRYRDRGSGIAIDALVSARPVVITGDSTLEEYVRGQNGLCAVSDQEFAQALATIVQHYDRYSVGAAGVADAVRADQSASPFYARLSGRS